MSKFWGGVGLLVIIGTLAAISAGGSSNIMVNDLETECRGDRTEDVGMSLNADNSISFTGHFPVENTNSDITYQYSKSTESITLNVESQNLPRPPTFWNNCLASAVYDFDTQPLEEGTYNVEIKHNEERVEKKVIRVK